MSKQSATTIWENIKNRAEYIRRNEPQRVMDGCQGEFAIAIVEELGRIRLEIDKIKEQLK